ncbi:MAG: BatD family protein, partial [Holophagales bacterium]|nr:BatD family protein [Holophagales bacterium]
ELKGEGHLQGLPEPVLPELPDLQVFPPQQQSDSLLKGTRVHGSRVWSYVLVPQKPGAVELPAISIPYFDPRPGEYRRAEVDTALTLAVRGSTRSARMDGTEVKLHPIRTASLPTLEPAAGPSSPWWHALILVPVAAALVLILLPSRRASEPRGAGGPKGNRRHHGSSGRRAARQHLLRELQEAVADDRPRQTAARVEEAWRGYLSERWNIPTGTASSRWSQLLEAEGVSPAAAEELVQLADDLHYLRYAPKLSSTDDLRRELVERSRRLVKSL